MNAYFNYIVIKDDGANGYNPAAGFQTKDEAIEYAEKLYAEKEPVNPRDTDDVIYSARTAEYQVWRIYAIVDGEVQDPDIVYTTNMFYNE